MALFQNIKNPQMNQIHLSNLTSTFFQVINFVFFSFFFLGRNALAVDENFTICSEPRSCGRQSIKYPFIIQGEQDRRCGFPGFNISCRKNRHPILSLPDGDYIIQSISYQTQSFQVSSDVPFNTDAVCSHSINNVSIPEDRRFYLPRDQKEVVFLFNCNLTSQPTWVLSQYKVNCTAEAESNATLALFNDDPMLDFASENCDKTVAAPVASGEGEGGVEVLLKRGFVLNWTASDCSICNASGGYCGFDYSIFQFKCFCPDRPQALHCVPGKFKLLSLSPLVNA